MPEILALSDQFMGGFTGGDRVPNSWAQRRSSRQWSPKNPTNRRFTTSRVLAPRLQSVMTGLVPAIHVDPRVKPAGGE